MTNTITVEEGLWDFRKSGLKPLKGVLVLDHKGELGGCLLGAMYMARGGTICFGVVPTKIAIDRLEADGFSPSYIGGLVAGFDNGYNSKKAIPEDYNLEEYHAGLLVGAEVKERLELHKGIESTVKVPEVDKV